MLNKFIILLLSIFLVGVANAQYKPYTGLDEKGRAVPIPDPNYQLKPNEFYVYTDGKVIINHPAPGFTKVPVTIDNSYTQNPGCYIACYSHDFSPLKVANDIFVQGQIRVPGKYNDNRICLPAGFEQEDISKAQAFSDLCSTRLKACEKKNCWAGGDTGGWYGMQQK